MRLVDLNKERIGMRNPQNFTFVHFLPRIVLHDFACITNQQTHRRRILQRATASSHESTAARSSECLNKFSNGHAIMLANEIQKTQGMILCAVAVRDDDLRLTGTATKARHVAGSSRCKTGSRGLGVYSFLDFVRPASNNIFGNIE